MDKSLRSFLLLSSLLVVTAGLVLTLLGAIYRYSTIYTYNSILLFVILLTILVMSVFVLSTAAVYHVYKRRRAAAWVRPLAGMGLRILFPLIAGLSRFVKGGKDAAREFFVTVNNIIVQSALRKYDRDRILVLLPHCLQYAGCTHKVTGSLSQCTRCGRCKVGELAKLAEQTGVQVQVVTGGTVARQLVGSTKPQLILSVACERDLVSGIRDVAGIPVIGIVNQRPNGPCSSTTVDVNEIRQYLEQIIRDDR